MFFDFPYEHCAYYSDDFLGRLLAAAGFSIVTIQSSYEGQYFSLCVRKCGEPCEIQTASPACLTRIRQRFSKIGQGIQPVPRTLPDSGVYLWGGGRQGGACVPIFCTEYRSRAVLTRILSNKGNLCLVQVILSFRPQTLPFPRYVLYSQKTMFIWKRSNLK